MGTPRPEFDIERLRVPQDYAARVPVQVRLTALPVRKPNRHEFVRIHPGDEYRLDCLALFLKSDRDETYLLDPGLAHLVPEEITMVSLRLAVSRRGAPFLWPLKLPRDDRTPNPWMQSALEAAEVARGEWVSVRANMELGAYEAHVAIGDLGEPTWPDLSMAEAVKLAFRSRCIESEDHPVLRELRGEV